MKTDNLEVAKRLAQITGKPLEEFYDMPDDEREEETVEDEAVIVEEETPVHAGEDGCEEEEESESEICGDDIPTWSDLDLKILAKKYDARIVNNRIMNGRQMTKKEFNEVVKEIISVDHFWKHPLLYKMFRSEGQLNPAFPEWGTKMEKLIGGKK